MSHQDWDTEILNRQSSTETSGKKQTVVLSEQHSKFVKLESCTGEDVKHETVTYTLRMEIQKARNANKMTQKQLAERLGISAKIIHDYESGKAIPNPQLLVKMSRVLGVKLKK